MENMKVDQTKKTRDWRRPFGAVRKKRPPRRSSEDVTSGEITNMNQIKTETKRGRPFGSLNKEKPSRRNSENVTSGEITNSNQIKTERKRGRPFGSLNKEKPSRRNSEDVTSGEITNSNQIKTEKKRGRPFGSLNKEKPSRRNSEDVTSGEITNINQIKTERKRGRPFGSLNKKTLSRRNTVDVTLEEIINVDTSIPGNSSTNDNTLISTAIIGDTSENRYFCPREVSTGSTANLKEARVILVNILHTNLIPKKEQAEVDDTTYISDDSSVELLPRVTRQSKKRTQRLSISSVTDSTDSFIGKSSPILPKIDLTKVKVEPLEDAPTPKTCRTRRSSDNNVEKQSSEKKSGHCKKKSLSQSSNASKESTDKSSIRSSSSENVERTDKKKKARGTGRQKNGSSGDNRKATRPRSKNGKHVNAENELSKIDNCSGEEVLKSPKKREQVKRKTNASEEEEQSSDLSGATKTPLKKSRCTSRLEESPQAPKITNSARHCPNFGSVSNSDIGSGDHSDKPPILTPNSVRSASTLSSNTRTGAEIFLIDRSPPALENTRAVEEVPATDTSRLDESPQEPNITNSVPHCPNFGSVSNGDLGSGDHSEKPPTLTPNSIRSASTLSSNTRAAAEILSIDRSPPALENTRAVKEVRATHRSPSAPAPENTRAVKEVRATDRSPSTPALENTRAVKEVRATHRSLPAPALENTRSLKEVRATDRSPSAPALENTRAVKEVRATHRSLPAPALENTRAVKEVRASGRSPSAPELENTRALKEVRATDRSPSAPALENTRAVKEVRATHRSSPASALEKTRAVKEVRATHRSPPAPAPENTRAVKEVRATHRSPSAPAPENTRAVKETRASDRSPPALGNIRAVEEVRATDRLPPAPALENTRAVVETRASDRSPPALGNTRAGAEVRATDHSLPVLFSSGAKDPLLLDENDCAFDSIARAIEQDLASGNRLSPIGDCLENIDIPIDLLADTCCLRKEMNSSTPPNDPKNLEAVPSKTFERLKTSSNISASTASSETGRKRKRPIIVKEDILPKGTVVITSEMSPPKKRRRIATPSPTVVCASPLKNKENDQNSSERENNTERRLTDESVVKLPNELQTWLKNQEIASLLDDNLNNNQKVNIANKNTLNSEIQGEGITLYNLPTGSSLDFSEESYALSVLPTNLDNTNSTLPNSSANESDCLEINCEDREVDEAIESFNASVTAASKRRRETEASKPVEPIVIDNVDKVDKLDTHSNLSALPIVTTSSKDRQTLNAAECGSESTHKRKRSWVPGDNAKSKPEPKGRLRLDRKKRVNDVDGQSDSSSLTGESSAQLTNCRLTSWGQQPKKTEVKAGDYSRRVIDKTNTNFQRPSMPIIDVQEQNDFRRALPVFDVEEDKWVKDFNANESAEQSDTSFVMGEGSAQLTNCPLTSSQQPKKTEVKVDDYSRRVIDKTITNTNFKKPSRQIIDVQEHNDSPRAVPGFGVEENKSVKDSGANESSESSSSGSSSGSSSSSSSSSDSSDDEAQPQSPPTRFEEPENTRSKICESGVASRGICKNTKEAQAQRDSRHGNANEKAAGSFKDVAVGTEEIAENEEDDLMSLFAESLNMSRCSNHSPPHREAQLRRCAPQYERMKSENIDPFVNANKREFNAVFETYRDKVDNDRVVKHKAEQKTIFVLPPIAQQSPDLGPTDKIQLPSTAQTVTAEDLRSKLNSMNAQEMQLLFRGHCFAWLKNGVCKNQLLCRFRHVLKPQLLVIDSLNGKNIEEILKYAICCRYRFFIEHFHMISARKMTTKQILSVCDHLYKARLLTERIVASTVIALATNGFSLMETIASFDSIIVPSDKETPEMVIRYLYEGVEAGSCWEILGKMMSRVIPMTPMIERVLEECLHGEKSNEHVVDVYENMVKRLPADLVLTIRPDLRNGFYDLLKVRDTFNKSAHAEGHQREIVGDCDLTSSIASPDSIITSLGRMQPDQLAEVEVSKLRSASGSRRSSTCTAYSLTPIDNLPPPKSPYRDKLWRFHLDLQGVRDGLRHKDYNLVISILTQNINHPRRLPHMKGFYNILCEEIRTSKQHLAEIIRLTVQSGASNSLRQFVFDLGVLVLTKLADSGLWVLAYELLKTFQVYGTYNTCGYTLLAAEICIANYRPLKALTFLKQSQIVFMDPKVWNQMLCPNDEFLRVTVMEFLLLSFCDGYAQHALSLLQFILSDQCSCFKPINCSLYLNKIGRALLAEKHMDSIIDFGGLILQAQLSISPSTFRALINSIFHSDRVLAKQLHRYAMSLGVYNTAKIGRITHMIINNDWTEEEVYLMLSSLIHDLSINIGHAIGRLGPRQLSVFLILETIPSEKDLCLDVCRGPTTNSANNKRKAIVRSVLERFDPKIKLVQKSQGRFCKIQSKSLVDYLKAEHSEH